MSTICPFCCFALLFWWFLLCADPVVACYLVISCYFQLPLTQLALWNRANTEATTQEACLLLNKQPKKEKRGDFCWPQNSLDLSHTNSRRSQTLSIPKNMETKNQTFSKLRNKFETPQNDQNPILKHSASKTSKNILTPQLTQESSQKGPTAAYEASAGILNEHGAVRPFPTHRMAGFVQRHLTLLKLWAFCSNENMAMGLPGTYKNPTKKK